jgi:Fe-Mn family superoxide dismutase
MKLEHITESKKNRESKLEVVKLPFKMKDLSPVLSEANINYHYNVLTKAYVRRYNDGEGDADFNYGGAKLHNMFWLQLQAPRPGNKPTGEIKKLIESKHKTFDAFKKELIRSAMTIQGSGWVYVAKNGNIKTTPNQSYKTDILMPVDMWEHSFSDYVPAKDAKKKYIEGMMSIINWESINLRLKS